MLVCVCVLAKMWAGFSCCAVCAPPESSTWLPGPIPALCSSGGWICPTPTCCARWELPREKLFLWWHWVIGSGRADLQAVTGVTCRALLGTHISNTLSAELLCVVTEQGQPLSDRDFVITVLCRRLTKLMTTGESRGRFSGFSPSFGLTRLVCRVWSSVGVVKHQLLWKGHILTKFRYCRWTWRSCISLPCKGSTWLGSPREVQLLFSWAFLSNLSHISCCYGKP